MRKIFLITCLLSIGAFAQTATEYFRQCAYQYTENKLPSAEITCREGLSKFPSENKLQWLLERILERKDAQKEENQKNNDSQKNNSDNSENSDNSNNSDNSQNDSNENAPSNESSSDSENSPESSSSESENNNDGKNGADGGNSSSSPSDSNEQPQAGASDENQNENSPEEENDPAQISPEQASQLLKDFDEQSGERKPWKPARGTAYPEKDW